MALDLHRFSGLLEACRRASELLSRAPLQGPARKRLKRDRPLRNLIFEIQASLHTCAEVHRPASRPSSRHSPIKAVTWNLERGKGFEAIAHALSSHDDLKDADLYFLTEVDWGMARSANRNVAAELGKALGLYAYFAPSYFNLTAGHGSERNVREPNALGLHGKAILSRLPLDNVRVSAITNATDKLKSKEVRIGQKRALIGDLPLPGGAIGIACVHLDAFSSPRMRARQFREAVSPLQESCPAAPLLVAGDWNTNTMNSTSGGTLFLTVLRQLIFPGPGRMITRHHPHPERKFDRQLFLELSRLGLEYQDYNEPGAGTFDLLTNDMEMGQMAKDQFPEWILRWINRILAKSGGHFSLKLDWFAGRGLRPLLKKVVRLQPGLDHDPAVRPSDHHPVLLTFETLKI